MDTLRRLSLRTRVLLIATALLAVGLAVGSLVMAGALQRYLVERMDGQLRPAARILALLPSTVPPAVGSARAGQLFGGNNYVAYLEPDGTVRTATDRPDAPSLPVLDTAAVAARDGRPFTVDSVDGEQRWRAIALPRRSILGPEGAGEQAEGSVVVAVSYADIDATIAKLRSISLIAGGSLLAVLAGVGWVAVNAGLRPLRRIEETSAAIARGDLSRRVPELAAPATEVGRVAAALNGMLDRNEAAFMAMADSEARMRRFVADASHELRTPLAGIKGFTKLYRMGAMSSPHEVAQAMTRIEQESDRLTCLVEDLLLLAQIDEHQQFPLHVAPMDLRTVAVDAMRDLLALDPTRTVELTGPGAGPAVPAPAMADEARLRQVVANLVGNAVAHTPSGTPVRIGVGVVDGEALLEVADTGPGMTPDQAARVFERFNRGDTSRSRSGGGGSGLGLAIVASLVTAHGGRVELTTAPGEGANFRVFLPTAEVAA